MSTPIVVDEWIYSDLRGDNEEDGPKQLQLSLFLERMLQMCDHFIVVKNSKLHNKINEISKIGDYRGSSDDKAKYLARHFMRSFFPRKDKIVWLEPEDLKELDAKLKAIEGFKDDDYYLLKAHLNVPGSLIITTDDDLIKAVGTYPGITIKHRDNFLPNYLKN